MSESTSPSNCPPDAAFVQALTESQTALRAYCEAALGHCEEAKDAWQKANMVLWRKAGEWNPQTRFLSWALAVARYEVLAVVRDRQRERLMFDDDVVRLMADAALKHAESHDSRREALHLCLETLQKRHRDMLTAHYVLGHGQSVIASVNGMTVGAVKVLMLRVRRTLADCIVRRTDQQSVLS